MKTKTALAILILCVSVMWGLAIAQAQTAPPTLSLKDSIPKAEGALAEVKLSLSNYWLYSITLGNSSQGNYWYYSFHANTPSEFNQVFMKVYMDGHVEISGGPERA